MNYYEILEISRNASEEVIKNAYRALVKKYHPDKNGHSLITEERMSQINEAYETLIDKEKRAIYDNELLFKDQEEKRLEEEKIYNDIVNNNSNGNLKFSNYQEVDESIKKKSLKEKFESLSEKQKRKVILITAIISFFVVFLVTFLISSLCTPSTKKENKEELEEKKNEENYEFDESDYDTDNYENNSDYEVNNFHDEEVIEKESKENKEENEKTTENTNNKENVTTNKEKENQKNENKKDNIVTIY